MGHHESLIGADAEMVGLICRLSGLLNRRQPGELISEETDDFSAQKSCFNKRLGTSDELSCRQQHWVVF
jgi:hypothetical protein